MKKTLSVLTLFTSASTLICCAIPALLVTLGFGAALAGFVGTFPQLIWFSEHKLLLFGVGAVMLVLGGLMQWRSRCPADGQSGAACQMTRGWSVYLYYISVALYLLGAFFAFVIARI